MRPVSARRRRLIWLLVATSGVLPVLARAQHDRARATPGNVTRISWSGREAFSTEVRDSQGRLGRSATYSMVWRASWNYDPSSGGFRPVATSGSVTGTATSFIQGKVECSGPITGIVSTPAVSVDQAGTVTFEAAAIPGWPGAGDLSTCYGGLVPGIGVASVSRATFAFKAKAKLSALLNGSASATDSGGFDKTSTYQGIVCIKGCVANIPANNGGYQTIGPVTTPKPNLNDPIIIKHSKLTWSIKASVGTAPGVYVALGDSYSSGEGAGDYFAGTASLVNACHRSHNAWPVLVARELGYKQFDGAPGRDSEFAACSGAIVDDLDNFSQGAYLKGLDKKNLDEPPQREHLLRSDIKLVTLSFGGNDIGFGPVITDCVKDGLLTRARETLGAVVFNQLFSILTSDMKPAERDQALANQGDTCQSQHASETTVSLRKLIPRLIKSYQEVADLAPGAKILVVGYPNFFPAKLAGPYCANVILRSDVEWASQLITGFDTAVEQAVARAGRGNLAYVAPSPTWAGHTICDAQPWFVPPDTLKGGLLAFASTNFPVTLRNLRAVYEPGTTSSEFFHPNVAGQRALAEAVAAEAQG